jgi:hypothetical protein
MFVTCRPPCQRGTRTALHGDGNQSSDKGQDDGPGSRQATPWLGLLRNAPLKGLLMGGRVLEYDVKHFDPLYSDAVELKCPLHGWGRNMDQRIAK